MEEAKQVVETADDPAGAIAVAVRYDDPKFSVGCSSAAAG